jgi:hypothetical protein
VLFLEASVRQKSEARAGMRRIRLHVRFGSCFALFALVIQFLVTFGHMHYAELTWPSTFLPRSSLTIDISSAALPGTSLPSKPVGIAFDYCAICAVTNLTASGVPAAAPGLPVPAALGAVRFQGTPDVSLAALPHLLFRARAPPLS